MQTHSFAKLALGSALVLATACGGKDAPAADASLQSDLSLASQAQAYRAQQFVSPQELAAQGYPYGPPAAYPYGAAPTQAGYVAGPYTAPAPAPRAVERVVYRTRSASSGGRSTGSSSGGGVYRAPQPQTTTVKHGARDAAIGAAAGAAIGVATSARKDRLKGGLLGAVVGAAAGAVVGNNVDKHRVPVPF